MMCPIWTRSDSSLEHRQTATAGTSEAQCCAVCWMLCAVCWMLCAVRWMLCAVRCVLCAVCDCVISESITSTTRSLQSPTTSRHPPLLPVLLLPVLWCPVLLPVLLSCGHRRTWRSASSTRACTTRQCLFSTPFWPHRHRSTRSVLRVVLAACCVCCAP